MRIGSLGNGGMSEIGLATAEPMTSSTRLLLDLFIGQGYTKHIDTLAVLKIGSPPYASIVTYALSRLKKIQVGARMGYGWMTQDALTSIRIPTPTRTLPLPPTL